MQDNGTENGRDVAVAQPSGGGERKHLLHPMAGAAILGFDWLLFSGNVATGGMGTLPIALLGFVLGGVGTAVAQYKLGRDSLGASVLKGLAGGVLVGIPTPLAGTFAGAAILSVSGLGALKDRARARAAEAVLSAPKQDGPQRD